MSDHLLALVHQEGQVAAAERLQDGLDVVLSRQLLDFAGAEFVRSRTFEAHGQLAVIVYGSGSGEVSVDLSLVPVDQVDLVGLDAIAVGLADDVEVVRGGQLDAVGVRVSAFRGNVGHPEPQVETSFRFRPIDREPGIQGERSVRIDRSHGPRHVVVACVDLGDVVVDIADVAGHRVARGVLVHTTDRGVEPFDLEETVVPEADLLTRVDPLGTADERGRARGHGHVDSLAELLGLAQSWGEDDRDEQEQGGEDVVHVSTLQLRGSTRPLVETELFCF